MGYFYKLTDEKINAIITILETTMGVKFPIDGSNIKTKEQFIDNLKRHLDENGIIKDHMELWIGGDFGYGGKLIGNYSSIYVTNYWESAPPNAVSRMYDCNWAIMELIEIPLPE